MAKKKKKRIGLWVGVLIGIIILLLLLKSNGCIGGAKGIKVVVDSVSTRDIIQTVEASGKIYPETEVLIKADVSGEIVALPVLEGDSVVKGQLLMKIDPVIYTTEVSQAEAQLDKARSGLTNAQQMAAQAKAHYDRALADFQRNQKLYQSKVISASEFEQYKSDYEAAKASYEAAKANISGSRYSVDAAHAAYSQSKENLNRTIIKAPTSGIISQLLVKNGERVVGTQQMDGSLLMTIADLGHMEVRVDVSETEISKVNIGDSCIIRADAFRNHTFKGLVTKIAVSSVALNNSPNGSTGLSGSTDEVTNYTVHILILPDSYQDIKDKMAKGHYLFKPGMSAGVEIQTQKVSNVLTVPINAVTTRDLSSQDSVKDTTSIKDAKNDMQTVVFLYNSVERKVKTQKVKTGVQDNEYIQILNGLKKGDKVITAPYSAIARILENNSSVMPVDKEKLYQSDGND